MTRRREPSLPELVRDTPVRALTPVDEECLALLHSSPPPPMPGAYPRPSGSMRQWSNSDVFDVEAITQAAREAMAREAARKIEDERALHAKELEIAELKADKRRLEDKAEAKAEAIRKFWATVIAGILVGAVLGVGGWVAVVLIEASRHP